MRDGKIADEHQVGTPFEEDLAEFRRSGLVQAIVEGEEETEALQQFDAEERRVLRRLLKKGAK
jgi:hypothetical protein